MATKRKPQVEENLTKVSVWTLLGAIVFLVVGDRIGPEFFERWDEINDFAFTAIVAALVSLVLGKGVGLFRRQD